MFSVEEWCLTDRFRTDKQNGRAGICIIWNWSVQVLSTTTVLRFPLWYKLCKKIPLIWPRPPPPLSVVQHRVLILDLNSLPFKKFDVKYGESMPYASYCRRG